MQVGTTKDQGLYNKLSAAVLPGALAARTLPQYNTIQSHLQNSVRNWIEIEFMGDQFTSLIYRKTCGLVDCDAFYYGISLLKKKVPASELEGLGSNTCQSVWDLWWRKCHCYKPLSLYFGLLLSIAFHQ